MLEIRNVTKSFKNKKVLDDLTLTVGDGTIFGLVGVNGAGKSTLFRLIAGVYGPDTGSITLDGKDTFKEVAVRRKIAFVSDETQFPFAETIKSMKELYKTFYDFNETAYRDYLDVFELDENGQINNFSKGMKRRVSLLFALALRPRLLLLDEAYDGLEPLARHRLKQILGDMLEDGVSVIISSHNLKELEDICDTFGILDCGKIKESGDLLDARSGINKYQLAFTEVPGRDLFDADGLDIVRYDRQGQVIWMVIKGDRKEVTAKLQAHEPLLLNVLPVNFEELFIYEVDKK